MEDAWVLFIFIPVIIITTVISVVYECRKASNTLPDGKKAIENFTNKVGTIQSANNISDTCAFANKNGKTFTVKVVDSGPKDGLEWHTIPAYKCNSVFINDEEVVRVHKLHQPGKDVYYLEFSRNRERDEIVEIVEAAYKVANETHRNYIHDVVCGDKTSFYLEG